MYVRFIFLFTISISMLSCGAKPVVSEVQSQARSQSSESGLSIGAMSMPSKSQVRAAQKGDPLRSQKNIKSEYSVPKGRVLQQYGMGLGGGRSRSTKKKDSCLFDADCQMAEPCESGLCKSSGNACFYDSECVINGYCEFEQCKF